MKRLFAILMLVTLIGYRGTGKTSMARPLAERLGWGWVDADVEIELRAGKSIREIFADEGEAAFREHEREVMQTLLDQSKIVIAAGGGAVLNEQTRQEMKAAGPVVWLKASPQTIVARLNADSSTADRRPNLTATGGQMEVERLLAIREPLYRECADLVIDTEGREIDDIVDELLVALEPRLREGAAE